MNSVVHNPTGPRALATTAFLLIVTIGVSLTALDRPVATFVHQAFASPILFRLASVFFSGC